MRLIQKNMEASDMARGNQNQGSTEVVNEKRLVTTTSLNSGTLGFTSHKIFECQLCAEHWDRLLTSEILRRGVDLQLDSMGLCHWQDSKMAPKIPVPLPHKCSV